MIMIRVVIFLEVTADPTTRGGSRSCRHQERQQRQEQQKKMGQASHGGLGCGVLLQESVM